MREKNPGGTAVALCAVVGLVLGLGACAEDSIRQQDVGAARSATATASASQSSSPSPADEGESKAIETYRAMWEDAAAASRTSDPKHPRLNDHAKGNALSLLRYMMEQTRNKGATSKGAASVAPNVVKSTKAKVELLDCVDGSKWVQVKPSGSPEGIPGAHYRTEATVAFNSGKWMVSELYWGEAGSCME